MSFNRPHNNPRHPLTGGKFSHAIVDFPSVKWKVEPK